MFTIMHIIFHVNKFNRTKKAQHPPTHPLVRIEFDIQERKGGILGVERKSKMPVRLPACLWRQGERGGLKDSGNSHGKDGSGMRFSF